MIRATVLVLMATLIWIGLVPSARAQTEGIPDTVFVTKPHQPISYYTSYDRNTSRATWLQSLSYARSGRTAFNIAGTATTTSGVHGVSSDGFNGDVNASVNFMALKNWTWSLDGRFGLDKDKDNVSTTVRRQNKLQIRTQYTVNPLPKVSAMALVFAEFQQEQSLGDKKIPVSRANVDSVFATHASHDSSYTSGRRDGASGTLTWKPASWLEVGGTGGTTSITTTTATSKRDFWVSQTVGVTDSLGVVDTTITLPNGDDHVETHMTLTGRPGTTVGLVLRANKANQQFYALTLRNQEKIMFGTRAAALHAETVPFTGSQASLDLGLDRSYRDYDLQSRLNSLTHGGSAAGQFIVYRRVSRAILGFLFTRTRSENQETQNGTVISRALNASGTRRVSRRLWLDGGGSVALFTRHYEDSESDKDDVRGYLNAGGGYLVSQRCSTAVHFSINRTHAVAISFRNSGNNNVQTTYQMDASVRLQASRTFSILQNYQINANYFIYDYNERANTLNRIRRIDTTFIDSLFTFASIRLAHNFLFQDRGGFTRQAEDEPRAYSVDNEVYAQTLTVGVNIRLLDGVFAGATQSLFNSRNYFTKPGVPDTNSNKWNLNLGLNVDRDLPGAMRLDGVVQRIGEYTERPGSVAVGVSDYWLAGVTLTKDF